MRKLLNICRQIRNVETLNIPLSAHNVLKKYMKALSIADVKGSGTKAVIMVSIPNTMMRRKSVLSILFLFSVFLLEVNERQTAYYDHKDTGKRIHEIIEKLSEVKTYFCFRLVYSARREKNQIVAPEL